MNIVYVQYQESNENTIQGVYFITPSLLQLIDYIKFNYSDWKIIDARHCGELFDVVNGRIVGE
jgi:hypothetical protein